MCNLQQPTGCMLAQVCGTCNQKVAHPAGATILSDGRPGLFLKPTSSVRYTSATDHSTHPTFQLATASAARSLRLRLHALFGSSQGGNPCPCGRRHATGNG